MIVYLGLTVLILFLAAWMRELQRAGADEKKRTPEGEIRLRTSEADTHSRAAYLYRGCVSLSFLLLFALSSLRRNVGNDYESYREFMHLAYSRVPHIATEVGFNLLARGVYTFFGFENDLAVFAIYAFLTLLFFFLAFRKLSVSLPESLVLFLLLGFYFQTMGTVRYYFVLSIALYSLSYFLEGDYPRFVLLVLMGALFHKSVLVVFVFYPLAKIKWRRGLLAAGGGLLLSCLFLQKPYLALLLRLYPTYENTEYLSGGTSLPNVARLVLLLLLYFYVRGKKSDSEEEVFYLKCNVLALLLYLFCSFVPILSRIAYYLVVTQLLLLPSLLKGLREKQAAGAEKNEVCKRGRFPQRKGRRIQAFVWLFCLMTFAHFMAHAKDDGIRLLPYQTFLFHDPLPLVSDVGYGSESR